MLELKNGLESYFEISDLDSVLEKARELLKRIISKKIEIEMRLSKDLSPVRLDPFQIEHCLINLCINARDAIAEKNGQMKIEDGGIKAEAEESKIIIGTENVILDKGYCRQRPWARPGKYALITISDTGIGMSKDVQEHIFDPLFTTKGKGEGTGLGLFMVYNIVKNHQGLIDVYSEPGKGTSFGIYLPAVGSEASVENEDSDCR